MVDIRTDSSGTERLTSDDRYARCSSNKRWKVFFGVVGILCVIGAVAFVTLALTQHYQMSHISGKFGTVLGDSGKWIVGALNSAEHGLAVAWKTLASTHDGHLVLTGLGSFAGALMLTSFGTKFYYYAQEARLSGMPMQEEGDL